MLGLDAPSKVDATLQVEFIVRALEDTPVEFGIATAGFGQCSSDGSASSRRTTPSARPCRVRLFRRADDPAAEGGPLEHRPAALIDERRSDGTCTDYC
jgi:hypothetical protein